MFATFWVFTYTVYRESRGNLLMYVLDPQFLPSFATCRKKFDEHFSSQTYCEVSEVCDDEHQKRSWMLLGWQKMFDPRTLL